MDTKRFNLMLTAAERATLEAKRAHLGLRSAADVLRHWIARAEDNPSSPQWSEREQTAMRERAAPPLVINRIQPSGVSFGPAPSPVGSRLKKR